MKIVEKYLWQSVLVPLFFVIAALFTLWLTFDIFDKIGRLIEKGPSAWLLTKYFLVQLPDLAQSILPVGVLFATLYVLAYFSRHRESVALLAAGMSPMILARPFLLCSAGLSLVLYFLSFSLSPTAQANREKVKRQIKKESTEENSFSQVVYRSPKMAGKTEGTIWYIGRLDLNAKTLQNVEILFRTEPEGRDLAKVFAASGEYRNGIWHLQNARRIEYGKEIGLETAGPILSELQLPELTEPPTMLAAKLVPPDVLPWPDVARLAGDTARLNERLRAPYATENWHRWMYPLACPLLCLFGIAFGMTDARRNVAATIFSSVFVLFGFLVWTRLSIALGQGNRIPSFLAGTSSIILFGAGGLYLFAEKVGWLWELQGWSEHHPRAAVWLRRVGLIT
ncbi:YjgP/YjgQ family permease [bacterium]|nr:YjgP/YjgQ family permease [bacterium]